MFKHFFTAELKCDSSATLFFLFSRACGRVGHVGRAPAAESRDEGAFNEFP